MTTLGSTSLFLDQPLDQILINAHNTVEVFGNSTLETYALYRFLTAVVHDVYKPKNLKEIDKILDAGCFDPQSISEWCADNPLSIQTFCQVPNLIGLTKSIGYLTMDLPTGSNSIHFRHNISDNKKCHCCKCIMLGLINLSPWETIGGKGFHASLNGAPPLYFLPRGSNLFETLALSLVAGRDCLGVGSWRRSVLRKEIDSPCYLVGLTFMPRQIKINWQKGDRQCTRCGATSDLWAETMIFSPGEKYTGDSWRDPFVAYKPMKKNEDLLAPIRPFGSRNDWREFCAEIMAGEFLPEIVTQRSNHKTWMVFGVVTDKARTDEAFMVTLKKTTKPM